MSSALSKAVLQELALIRVAESESLFEAGYFSGAYYLGGYAIELGLKACIAEAFTARSIPDRRFVERIYTHDLLKLAEIAGLEAARSTRSTVDPAFAQHWRAVEEWSERARYATIDQATAHNLLDALRDPNHGVFEWIRMFW